MPAVMGLMSNFSGALDNVLQIGIEFHEARKHLRKYFDIVQRLYRHGFVVVAWEPNLVASRKGGPSDYFEVVFRKVDVQAECATH